MTADEAFEKWCDATITPHLCPDCGKPWSIKLSRSLGYIHCGKDCWHAWQWGNWFLTPPVLPLDHSATERRVERD